MQAKKGFMLPQPGFALWPAFARCSRSSRPDKGGGNQPSRISFCRSRSKLGFRA